MVSRSTQLRVKIKNVPDQLQRKIVQGHFLSVVSNQQLAAPPLTLLRCCPPVALKLHSKLNYSCNSESEDFQEVPPPQS